MDKKVCTIVLYVIRFGRAQSRLMGLWLGQAPRWVVVAVVKAATAATICCGGNYSDRRDTVLVAPTEEVGSMYLG